MTERKTIEEIKNTAPNLWTSDELTQLVLDDTGFYLVVYNITAGVITPSLEAILANCTAQKAQLILLAEISSGIAAANSKLDALVAK